MRLNTLKLCIILYLVFLLTSLGLLMVAAEDTVNIYVYHINHPEEWKGKTFTMDGGTYWVGEIHIQYGGTPPSSGTHTRAYCIEYDVILYAGCSYTYTITDAEDTQAWRSIAYVLSWHDPPSTDEEAAAVQGAIWKILTGYDPSGEGNDLATEAQGKDVIRSTDTFEWLTPEKYVGPGEEVTLIAKITKQDGSGRSGVRVKFTTTAGVLHNDEGITDANGEVSVTLTAPSEMGTVVEVTAYTRGVWPKKYLRNGETQDLIGLGDKLELTSTTEIPIIAYIHVIPEMPFGTLVAVATFFFAYIVKSKLKA